VEKKAICGTTKNEVERNKRKASIMAGKSSAYRRIVWDRRCFVFPVHQMVDLSEHCIVIDHVRFRYHSYHLREKTKFNLDLRIKLEKR
jgi:hypothetical protein